MKSFLALVLAVVAIIFIFFGFFYRSSRNNQSAGLSQPLSVVTSFYPLAYFAQQVGGDLIRVTSITPAGAEPHDYEPTPQDIVTVHKANVFIYNGGGVDAWAERVQTELEQSGVQVLSMQQHIALMSGFSEDQTGDSSTSTASDPHIWLDPVLAAQEVELIRVVLTKADPVHADAYQNNATSYTNHLHELDTHFTQGLAQCERREIVVTHNAFRYLSRRYHLNSYAIAGLSPEDEPSAQHIAELISLVRQRDIKYIFFESLVNPRLAETIARETGAVTAVLNPIEGVLPEQVAQGLNYDTIMEANLAALRQALNCQ